MKINYRRHAAVHRKVIAMNKCPECGAYIPEGGRMCIACGWKPEGDDGIFDNPIFKYMQDAFEKANPQMNENDAIPDEFRERDLAATGYIGPLFLYSLLKNSGSELIKYHAKQSAMLLALHMLNGVVGIVPYIGKPVKKINTAILVVLAFLGARNAYFGKKEPVPYVGQIISKLLEVI